MASRRTRVTHIATLLGLSARTHRHKAWPLRYATHRQSTRTVKWQPRQNKKMRLARYTRRVSSCAGIRLLSPLTATGAAAASVRGGGAGRWHRHAVRVRSHRQRRRGPGERHLAHPPCHSLAHAGQAPLLALAVSSEAHAIAALVAVAAPVGLAAGTVTAAHGAPLSIHDSLAIGSGHGPCPRGVHARHAQECDGREGHGRRLADARAACVVSGPEQKTARRDVLVRVVEGRGKLAHSHAGGRSASRGASVHFDTESRDEERPLGLTVRSG